MQIAIHGHHGRAPRQMESRLHGRGLAKIAAKVGDANPRVAKLGAFQQFEGLVRAAVIDKQKLRLALPSLERIL